MTATAIRLDQPASLTLPTSLRRLFRRVEAARRLLRYPSRRRAEIRHARHWATMHIAQQH
jgi:hypothetical protein